MEMVLNCVAPQMVEGCSCRSGSEPLEAVRKTQSPACMQCQVELSNSEVSTCVSNASVRKLTE